MYFKFYIIIELIILWLIKLFACSSRSESLLIIINVLQGAGYLKRADTDRLHEIFLKFATVDKNGEKFITSEDFVRKFLGLFDEGNVHLIIINLLEKQWYY